MTGKFVIGREEWVSLPDLGLYAIKAKIDSGAKTSALHAFNIHTYIHDDIEYVRFDVHPIQNNRKIIQHCHARLLDRRTVKSSNGEIEKRCVVQTTVKMGDHNWPIEITLTNRDSMGFRMLLGREAMTRRLLVDPDVVYITKTLSDKEALSLYSNNTEQPPSLNIVVFGSDPELYSNKRIMQAGIQRGHNMIFINVSYCYMNISATNPEVYYRGGKKLANIDAIIPRLRPSMTFHGCAIMRQFQASGVYCLNDSASIAKSRNKLRSLQIFSDRGLPMPVTGFANSPDDTSHLIKMVGGAPLIIKLLESTQGMGVVLAETNKAAESVINAFKSLKANILVQEFIKYAKGEDIRAFVIDGKVVCAMKRTAKEGEFRANLHLGGTCAPVKLTVEERKMAVRACKVLGLKVAGVDIIRSQNGPKLLEVNSSPGLEGIERATGEDIAGLMIEAIERNIGFPRKNR